MIDILRLMKVRKFLKTKRQYSARIARRSGSFWDYFNNNINNIILISAMLRTIFSTTVALETTQLALKGETTPTDCTDEYG